MRFVTVRDMRNNSADLRASLLKEKEIVLTANGKPFAVVIPATEDNLDKSLSTIRRLKAELALAVMQKISLEKGNDKLSLSDVNAEIRAVRKKRR